MLKVLLAVLLIAGPAFAASRVRVRGHSTKRGSYKAAHYRTPPDSRKTNNWSNRHNYNPYTGKKGSK